MTKANVRRILLRLPAEDYTALRNLAHFTGRSMNSIMVTVLGDYFGTGSIDALKPQPVEETKPL